jgi:hypothetical protein
MIFLLFFICLRFTEFFDCSLLFIVIIYICTILLLVELEPLLKALIIRGLRIFSWGWSWRLGFDRGFLIICWLLFFFIRGGVPKLMNVSLLHFCIISLLRQPFLQFLYVIHLLIEVDALFFRRNILLL